MTEQSDTTNRLASEERKELLSHMTNVNNVLTLLNGSLLGTHRLHFSLWPQPLRPLSVDPNDENLWYAELLKRRSSGIEGMQDFYAIAVIPRGEGFCLRENLRRVSVLESPLPDPPVQPSVLFDNFDFNLNDFVRVFVYLSGKYPQGMPIEELDVSLEDRLLPDPAAVPPFPTTLSRSALQAWYDAVGAIWIPNPLPPLPAPSGFDPLVLAQWAGQAKAVLADLPAAVKIDTTPRPVVYGWTFSNSLPPSMFRLQALTNPPSLPVPYKWVQDVWLEAAQYDYEAELAKSPLERGTILMDDRRVDICAAVGAEGEITDVTTTVPDTRPTGVFPPLPVRPVRRPWDVTTIQDPKTKGRSIVSAWATAEAQLAARLAGTSTTASVPFSFNEPRILEIYLRRATRLTATDEKNLPLAALGRQFRFSATQLEQLKAGGVTNLSSLASALLAVSELERLSQVQPFPRDRRAAESAGSLPPALVKALLRAIGESLDAMFNEHESRPARTSPPSQDRGRRRGKR